MRSPSLSTFPLKGKRFVKEAMCLLRSRLKLSHFKWSIQRERIVLAFLSHDHVSIRGLYASLNRNGHRTPVGTIYQTMRVLVKVGFAKPRDFGDRAQYDNIAVTGGQDQLICTRCGHIVEFENPVIVNLEEHIAASHGFHLTARKLEVYGVCPSCRDGGTPRFS
jgi:Fur family ferric uptake transcriptional regulator